MIDALGAEFDGVIGSDCFGAYRKFMKESSARIQFCFAHYIRDILFLLKLKNKAVNAYGERLLAGIRTLFQTYYRRDEMDETTYQSEMEAVRRRIIFDAMIDVPEQKDAQNVMKRLREACFRFITEPDIEPTNNVAERALRFIAIDRKLTNGTRSIKGNQWCEHIWTFYSTCKLRGVSFYEYLTLAVTAFFNGQPVPLPVADST